MIYQFHDRICGAGGLGAVRQARLDLLRSGKPPTLMSLAEIGLVSPVKGAFDPCGALVFMRN